MKWLMVLCALMVLASCGADGDPIPPGAPEEVATQ